VVDLPEFTDDQWTELLERLTYYCVGKFRKLGWWTGRNMARRAGPKGVTPRDIAFEAIEDVIEGRRRYEPAKHPDFREFLRSVVDSKVYHLARSAEARHRRPMPVRPDDKSGEPVEIEVPGDAPNPAEVCVNRDVIETIRGSVVAAAASDPLVNQLFECLESGYTKPADISELLEVDVAEIYKAKKRLRSNAERSLGKGKETRR